MLPGRTYKPEDILALVWKHRYLLVVPLIVGSFGGVLMSRFLPNLYQSETLIQVVPQRVPESYVQSTVTARVEDRLQSISQQIMSRTRLERIIQEFDLYPEQRRTAIMEDVVEQMRDKAIGIEMVGGRPGAPVDAFRVKFTYVDPRTAMRVTERLASLFMDESRRDRGSLADATSDFLNTQLADARTRLEEQDLKLKIFTERNQGKLPTQAQQNMQAIQTTQMQVQALVESLARDRDRKLMLERLFNDVNVDPEDMPVASAPVIVTNPDGTQSEMPPSAQEQLELGRALLAQMELRLTPRHPDIIRMKRSIAELEKKAQEEALQQPLSPTAAPPPPPNSREAERRAKILAMRAELESLDRQIRFKESEEQRLRGQIAEYQRRLEAVPGLQSEYISLNRDYDTLKRTYEDLLVKSEASKVSANLERRQIGEQFRVLDPARLPGRPISPNRLQINLMGVGIGLALGLALIALLEYKDSSFRTEGDIRSALVLPVVALIPRVVTRAEARRERRRRLLLGTVSVLLFVVVGGGLTYWLKLWNYIS
jgi:polysaccharide chain length determinant protein (PEP-CTERM system associated)